MHSSSAANKNYLRMFYLVYYSHLLSPTSTAHYLEVCADSNKQRKYIHGIDSLRNQKSALHLHIAKTICICIFAFYHGEYISKVYPFPYHMRHARVVSLAYSHVSHTLFSLVYGAVF